MENLNTALGLLVVGVITVMIVLWLVVIIGNLVVRLTNRFIPVKDTPTGGTGRGTADSKKMAAIVAAVDAVTEGKGNVDSIQRK